ncbi:MAG: hypothetical protein H0V80_14115 [Acidobacteria bacterium]|nr:hypothetical protein [Acidobacteriota bacterium]
MSSPKTRYFFFGSAAILAGGLAAGTFAYVGGLPMRALASNVGPEELSLVPAGATVVAYANVQGVMQSEFRQRLTTLMDHQADGRQKFQEKTGIDVERDIDAVIAAALPGADGSRSADFGFVALRGRFDTTKIEALVSSKGGRLDEYKGARLLVHSGDDVTAGEATIADAPTVATPTRHHVRPVVALVNANLVIVGTESAVKAAIDRNLGEGTPSITGEGEFVRMLENIDQNSTVWAIGRPGALGAHGDLPAQVMARIPEVRWFAASGHLNGGLRAMLRAEGKDAEAGQNLREVVQGVLALARLQMEGQPELKPLLQTLQVEGTGSGVTLQMTLPAEMLDVLVKHAGGVHADHLRQLHRANEN